MSLPSSHHMKNTDDEGALTLKKITRRLLRSITSDPFASVTFLDLSLSGIQRILGISTCTNLEILILHGNCIDTLPDLSSCPNLWKLDLSCNHLKDLCGFEKFGTFGTLIVSENKIKWPHLEKVAHLEILSLHMTDNRNLLKDEHYRKHVIKCLPKVWCLDGDLVTEQERRMVAQFFQRSADSKKPVRAKLPCHHFMPTFMTAWSYKVYGRRSISVWKSFGRTEVHNKLLDERRLVYMCQNLLDDFSLESCQKDTDTDISELLDMRKTEKEKFNMVLLLFVSSLVLVIPTTLMKSTLEVIAVSHAQQSACQKILNFPIQMRSNVVFLFWSFVKLDGPAEDISIQLFNTLKTVNAGLAKLAYGKNDVIIEAMHHHIIAAELVQVFCLVPNFSSYFSEESVIRLLSAATLNEAIESELKVYISGHDFISSRAALVEYVTLQIRKAKLVSTPCEVGKTIDRRVVQSAHRNAKQSLLSLQKRRTRPFTAPFFVSRNESPPNHGIEPDVGHKVLLGPQRLGHIVSLPDRTVVLIQVDSMPSSRFIQADFSEHVDVEHSLCYVNKDDLEWSPKFRSWILSSARLPNREMEDAARTERFEQRHSSLNLILQSNSSHHVPRSNSTILPDSTCNEETFSVTVTKGYHMAPRNGPSQHVKDSKSSHSRDLFSKNIAPKQRLEFEKADCNIVPLELDTIGASKEFAKIRQSNVYHLYPTSRASNVPLIRTSTRPKTTSGRRSDTRFLRTSNWLG